MSKKLEKLAADIKQLSPEGQALVGAVLDMSISAHEQPVDIFQWANLTVSVIDELDVQLYLLSKNNVIYSINHSKELVRQMRPLFIDDMIEAVFAGAETGMRVREIHTQDGETNALDFVAIDKVEVAQKLIHWIEQTPQDILNFAEGEHDINRMKGVIARFTPKTASEEGSTGPFYIFKVLQSSNVITGARSWSIENSGFKPNAAHAVVAVKPDNQVLIIGGTIYAFNVSKFTKLFNYDAKREVVINGKIAEIEKNFKLSFPDGITLKSLVDSTPALADKLLRSNPSSITAEQMIDQADEFDLALMTDDAGAIIIMDKRDALMFANLLNDDYVDSNMTGVRYLAIKKKEVPATVDSQVNMGV